MGLINNQKITVREYYDILRKEKIESHEWATQSLVSYDSCFMKHILPFFGDHPLARVSRIEYQSFLNKKLHEDGYSVTTLKTWNNCFSALVNHAVINGALERNRFKRLQITDTNYKPKNKVLTLEQYKKFMETAETLFAKDTIRLCMIYLATFGLRRGEVMGLTSRNVHFAEDGLARLDIKRTRTQFAPEGKGTKTPSSERSIVLDLQTSELLQLAIKEANEIKKDYNEILHQDDFIFISQKHNEPFHIGYLNVLMKRVASQCGFHVSPHMMRHTFTTQARLSGASDRSVADYLGHSSIVMTDHYTHPTEEGMKNVVDPARNRMN